VEPWLSPLTVLLIVVDPIGVAVIFHALTHELPRDQQLRTAVAGPLIAGILLIVFFWIGARLLSLLGISIAAFRIAGGLLLFLLAIDMVFARQSGLRSTTVRETKEATHRADVSVFPLAFPLIAGPGAFTTVLLMASAAHTSGAFIGMMAIIVGVLALTAGTLVLASALLGVLGETGANVIGRVFGLILSALAVQLAIDGLRAAFGI